MLTPDELRKQADVMDRMMAFVDPRREPIVAAMRAAADILAAQQDGAWQPIETAEADQALLVCNPDEGALPVIAWKVAGTWYQYGPGGKQQLDTLPRFWTRWAKLPRRYEQ